MGIEKKLPGMPRCLDCQDESYILLGCCDGRECGCRGGPVSITNCKSCNPKGDASMGEYVGSYEQHLEYVGVVSHKG